MKKMMHRNLSSREEYNSEKYNSEEGEI